MIDIEIRAVGADDWDAVEHSLTGGGDGGSCWCQWFLLSSAEWSATARDDKRSALRREVESGRAHALLAFVDGEAAAWCRVGPRAAQARLARSRIVRAGASAPIDDPSVWAVSCFVVRREHRGRGLQTALLRAAVQAARDARATRVEGYPVVVADGAQEPSNELYHGTLGSFERAGFTMVARASDRRAVVALDLVA